MSQMETQEKKPDKSEGKVKCIQCGNEYANSKVLARHRYLTGHVSKEGQDPLEHRKEAEKPAPEKLAPKKIGPRKVRKK